MKSLEIQAKKRLLIVEAKNKGIANVFIMNNYGMQTFTRSKYVCSGSDLTEEIASGMVDSMNFGTDQNPDIGYYDPIRDNYSQSTAIEVIISAIEAAGYHWRNPLADEIVAPDIDEWQDAESRTFHPEKVLIFEIVEG